MTRTMALWIKLKDKPMGKWLFARAVCWKAPYFSTIAPRFEELKPGYSRVSLNMKDTHGNLVVHADINIYVSPRKSVA